MWLQWLQWSPHPQLLDVVWCTAAVVVVVSTFPSQKCQKPTVSDHFWKLSWAVEKVHTVVARSTFPSRNVQSTAHHARTTFGSWDVEKVRAVVARSTFPSQNVQSTPCSDHFWKLRCRKSACRCGAKHVSKSKCTKHHMFGPPAALARLLFDHYLFAHLHLLSSDFLHLLSSHFWTSPRWLFPPLLFHLCILSEVRLLNFLRSILKFRYGGFLK